MIEWIKVPLTIWGRLGFLWESVTNFAQTWMFVKGEGISPHYEYYSWRERFETSISCLDTAIRGYVWGLRSFDKKVNKNEL